MAECALQQTVIVMQYPGVVTVSLTARFTQTFEAPVTRYAKALVLVSATWLATGCVENAPTTVLDERTIPRPRFTFDCTFSAAFCQDIQASINHLKNHDNAGCIAAGNAAQARFNASGYGFRPAQAGVPLPPATRAYVWMDANTPPQTTFTGYHSTDPNTYITELGIIQLTEELAGTIAHEEQHQSGMEDPNHTWGTGVFMANTCQQSS